MPFYKLITFVLFLHWGRLSGGLGRNFRSAFYRLEISSFFVFSIFFLILSFFLWFWLQLTKNVSLPKVRFKYRFFCGEKVQKPLKTYEICWHSFLSCLYESDKHFGGEFKLHGPLPLLDTVLKRLFWSVERIPHFSTIAV